MYLIKIEQGEDFFLNSDGGLASACFTGQIPLRATFIGGDLDVANAFALWGMRWATDRIDAPRDSRAIVDSTSAPSHFKSAFSLEVYRSSSRMDAMMFAPQADLYFIDEGSDPWIALPRFDWSSSFLNPFRYSL